MCHSDPVEATEVPLFSLQQIFGGTSFFSHTVGEVLLPLPVQITVGGLTRC